MGTPYIKELLKLPDDETEVIIIDYQEYLSNCTGNIYELIFVIKKSVDSCIAHKAAKGRSIEGG